MNCDDPYFEAFESNLRAKIRARVSGKTAALVQSLPERIRHSIFWRIE